MFDRKTLLAGLRCLALFVSVVAPAAFMGGEWKRCAAHSKHGDRHG